MHTNNRTYLCPPTKEMCWEKDITLFLYKTTAKQTHRLFISMECDW